MSPYRPCSACGRHVLTDETTCPHCGANVARAGGLRTAAGIALGLAALAGCSPDGRRYTDYGSSDWTDTDTDTDTDADTDADTDTDTDTDTDSDTSSDTGN